MAGIFGNDLPNVNPGTIGLSSQIGDLDTRKQLLMALLQNSMSTPTESIGGVAIRRSPLEFLARGLSTAMAGKGMNSIQQDRQTLLQNQQTQMNQALSGLLSASQGTPGTPSTVTESQGPPSPDGEPPAPMVQQGTPGQGPNAQVMAQALARASMSGVDPKMIESQLGQFNTNQRIGQYAPQIAPWNQGGGPASFTPGTASTPAQVSMPVGGGAPQGGGGNSMGGIPQNVLGMVLSGDAGLEKAASMINERTKPVNMRAGSSLVQYDANGNPGIALQAPAEGMQQAPGGGVQPVPGYVEAKARQAAATTGAEQAAEAPYKQIMVPMPDGSQVQMFLNQRNGMVSATPPGAGGQGASGGVPQGMGVTQTPAAKIESEGLATGRAEASHALDDQVNAMNKVASRQAEMRGLLQHFDPGTLTPMRADIAGYAQAVGLPDGVVNGIAGGNLGAIQSFDKQAVQTAFDATAALTKRPAAAEVVMQLKANANKQMTRPAIDAVMAYNDGLIKYTQEKQQARDAWLQSHPTLQGFEAFFTKASPIDSYVPDPQQLAKVLGVHAPQGAPAQHNAPQQPASPVYVNPKTGERVVYDFAKRAYVPAP